MKKMNKKGFTIVELVIVIAVIAILAAVLIPTFTGIIKKANISADVQLIRNLNTALKIDGKEHKTMQDALDAAFDSGFDVEKIDAKASENKILWDSKNDMFCYLEKDATEPSYHPESSPKVEYNANGYVEGKVNNVDLWEIVKEIPGVDNQKYSMYYVGEEVVENKDIKVGFDAGTSDKVKSINYVNNGAAQNVVIRTNSVATTLNINAGEDTVHHFGNVGKVDITNIDKTHCYNEYGNAAYVKLLEGKVVAKDGGSISVVFTTNDDASKVLVMKDNNAVIEQAYTTAQIIDETNRENGGIPLTYAIDETAVTEQSIQGFVEEAIDELAGEEVAEDPNVEYYVARIGTHGYASFQGAYKAALSGDKIVLLKNVVLGDSVEGNFVQEDQTTGFDFDKQGLTLDLNGNSLVHNVNVTYGFYIKPGADLTIKDSVGGGLISAPNAETVFSVYGILNIYGGTIKAEYISDPISDLDYGTYTFGSSAVRTERWNTTLYGTANIYGGKLIASTGATYNNYGLNNCGEANIYGGSFESNAYNNAACGIGNSAVLNIKNDIELYSFYWNNRNDNINSSVVNVDSGKAFVVDYLTIENYSDYPSMSINGNASYKTNDFSQGDTFEHALIAAENYDSVKYFVNYSE